MQDALQVPRCMVYAKSQTVPCKVYRVHEHHKASASLSGTAEQAALRHQLNTAPVHVISRLRWRRRCAPV